MPTDHRASQTSVTVWMPDPMYRWCVEHAARHGLSLSEVLRAGVERMMTAHGPCGVEAVDGEVAEMRRWKRPWRRQR
jgi:hypothetical protein